MKVHRLILRIILGMFIYIGFIQPKVWKYTVEILRPRYLHLDRIVLVDGVIIHREDVIKSPADGVILKLKGDGTRVANGEVIGVIFPDTQSYEDYLAKLDNILTTYKKMINERQDIVKQKTMEIEAVYKELSKDNEICKSLIENKKDASDIIKELDRLNKDILTIKNNIERMTLEIEALNKEKDNKLKDLEDSIINSYIAIHTNKAGILMFNSDSKESFRDNIIQGGSNSYISVKDIFGKLNTISNGDRVMEGGVIGRVIDNLESFAVCNIVLDGRSNFTHNRVEIRDGEVIPLNITKWVSKEDKEMWVGKIEGNLPGGDVNFSGVARIGEIEGVGIPKEIVYRDNRGYYVNIIESDRIKKRYIELLGGNQDWVVVNNLDENTQVLRNQ